MRSATTCCLRQRTRCDEVNCAGLNNVRAQSEGQQLCGIQRGTTTTVRYSTRYDNDGAVFDAVRQQLCGVRRGTTKTVRCSTRCSTWFDNNGAVFDAVRRRCGVHAVRQQLCGVHAVRQQQCGVRRVTTTTVRCSTCYDNNGEMPDALRQRYEMTTVVRYDDNSAVRRRLLPCHD